MSIKKIVGLCILGCLSLGVSAQEDTQDASQEASQELPKDVMQYITKRQACDQYRSMPSQSNPVEQKAVFNQVKKYCLGADAGLNKLTKKYKKSEAILNVLSVFEKNIEIPLPEKP